jgi:replication factor C large subunit
MHEPWTEKYRPRSLREIIGNETAVRSMRRWAESWASGIPRKRALVLIGEPGIGKTSAALALASDMKWDHIEMNASDHRNAASIQSVAGAGSANQTFSDSGEFMSTSRGMRKLVILDEADNLFGNQDRGGAKAISETIRNSGQPIVLIVNDYSELSRKSPAVKTLAEKAVFSRLSPSEVERVLKSIMAKEELTVPPAVLEKISTNASGDLRAAINDLQMMAEGRTDFALVDADALGKRNQNKEVQTVFRAMFRAQSIRDARDATFGLDLTPDNLIMWIEESAPAEIREPACLAMAFDAISMSDVFLRRTRQLQHYGLWAYAKELMTGGVALAKSGSPGPGPPEYRFPGQFIVMSRAKGPRAIRNSVADKVAGYTHTSRRCVLDSTLPFLSVMAKRDDELLVELGKNLDLDDADIGYLLGVDPDSGSVSRIMNRIKGETARAEDGGKAGKNPVRPRGRKELTKF